MNKLQEAIEWAREREGRLLASAGDGTTPDIFSQEYREQASHLTELITAAEQVERAKFGSGELIAAGDKAHENTSGDVDSYFDFTRGFNEGAAWVLKRMKGDDNQ